MKLKFLVYMTNKKTKGLFIDRHFEVEEEEIEKLVLKDFMEKHEHDIRDDFDYTIVLDSTEH